MTTPAEPGRADASCVNARGLSSCARTPIDRGCLPLLLGLFLFLSIDRDCLLLLLPLLLLLGLLLVLKGEGCKGKRKSERVRMHDLITFYISKFLYIPL